MAILRKNEIKQLNKESLDQKLSDLKRELVKVRSQIALGTLPENPGRTKEIRRTIARIITLKKSIKTEGGKKTKS